VGRLAPVASMLHKEECCRLIGQESHIAVIDIPPLTSLTNKHHRQQLFPTNSITSSNKLEPSTVLENLEASERPRPTGAVPTPQNLRRHSSLTINHHTLEHRHVLAYTRSNTNSPSLISPRSLPVLHTPLKTPCAVECIARCI